MVSTTIFPKKVITKIGGSCYRHFSSGVLKLIRKHLNLSTVENCLTVPSSIPPPPYVTTGVVNVPDQIDIKTDDQIKKMRPACQLAASILRIVGESIKVSYFSFYMQVNHTFLFIKETRDNSYESFFPIKSKYSFSLYKSKSCFSKKYLLLYKNKYFSLYI